MSALDFPPIKASVEITHPAPNSDSTLSPSKSLISPQSLDRRQPGANQKFELPVEAGAECCARVRGVCPRQYGNPRLLELGGSPLCPPVVGFVALEGVAPAEILK